MAYASWSVVFSEQPSAAKWNILGTNDASFNDGTGIADDAIITRHIADGSILSAQMDQDEVGFVMIGRTTLGSADDTISVASLPAYKYLRIIGRFTGANTRGAFRFNNDSGNNYTYRVSDNGGADSSGTAFNYFVAGDAASNAVNTFTIVDITNEAAIEKIGFGFTIAKTASGAATAPIRRETYGSWANTSAQINRVDLLNTSSGDFAIGSEVLVFGKN